MSIKVTVDMSGVSAKIQRICDNSQLQQVMATAGLRYMNQHYVPFLDGALRKSGVASPGKITWSAPYAHRHWSGYGDSNRNTPGTRSHWEQPKDVKEFIARSAQDWLRRQM